MSKNKYPERASSRYPKSNEALLLEYLIQQYKEEFFSILNTIFILDESQLSQSAYDEFYEYYIDMYSIFLEYNYDLLDMSEFFLRRTIQEEMYRHSHMFLCIKNTIEKVIVKGELIYEYR